MKEPAVAASISVCISGIGFLKHLPLGHQMRNDRIIFSLQNFNRQAG